MASMKASTRAALMVSHGFAMLLLGSGLLYIRAAMTNRLFEMLGCVFALLLIAASMLFIALSDVVSIVEARHLSGLRGLLAMSLVAAGAGALLVFDPGISLRAICACAAAYSFLMGLGKIHLARHWIGPRRWKAFLYGLTGVSFCFSAALALTATRSDGARGPLLAIAIYSLAVGVQTLAAGRYAFQCQSKTMAA